MLWFGLWLLCNVLNVVFWWQSDWPVHQLWPPFEGKQRTELDVVLFHGLQSTGNDTSDWPREWLPYDLGEAVRIFSISYNAHGVTSPHDHISEIVDNLFQTLMSPRYKNTSLSLSNCDAWAIVVVSLTNISSN